MTQHIGVDIVEIKRIKNAIERWKDRFLNRVFTPKELTLHGHRNSSLAARFAAKEAVFKAIGVGSGISWQDIEVLAEANGKPIINLSGKAQIIAQQLSIREIAVSLSHSDEYAVAFVVGITD